MKFLLFSTVMFLLLLFSPRDSSANSEFFEEFEDYYGLLSIGLLDQEVEVAEISNFIYQKDIATFTLESGRLYLARPILGRPTTALFIGKGNAKIEVPSHVERQSLWFVARDSSVNEEFEICLIRMSDDFDLKMKERFEFTPTTLGWKDFNKMAKAQGEYFFSPQVMHTYDNYFELLRSAYERSDDGYFWIDFNRYVYTFDPARPEQVIIAYEYEGGDEAVTKGAVMQRMENQVTEDDNISNIPYPVTLLSQDADLYLDGLDGRRLDSAVTNVQVRINRDSLRFCSMFLHSNLTVDSILADGRNIDFWRRGSFVHIGIILPEYQYKDDTVGLTFYYHGKDFTSALPFAADPSAASMEIEFNFPSGFNYIVPAQSEIVKTGKRQSMFTSAPAEPYRNYFFAALASGYDTIAMTGANGLPINIIKSSQINKKNYENFVPDKRYQTAVVAAIDFLSLRLGPPAGVDELYVFPRGHVSMPGLVSVPQVKQLINETGGIEMDAAQAAAQQWFGALTQPATDREYWILDALPDYLSLLFVRQELGARVFFGELGARRNSVYTTVENGEDSPLATGDRVSPTRRTAKGTWVFHMLRSLMFDLEKNSDRPFWKFVRELIPLLNKQTFTNKDFISLAEKHYGSSLDWFFGHWLYSRNIPEFKVEYKIEQRDGQYLISGDVHTEGVKAEYTTPVVMRVIMENDQASGQQNLLTRQQLSLNNSFELGPFTEKPKELVFNELYSVLCKQKVKKK